MVNIVEKQNRLSLISLSLVSIRYKSWDFLYRILHGSIFDYIIGPRKELLLYFKCVYDSTFFNGKNYFSNLFTDTATSFRLLSFLNEHDLKSIPPLPLDKCQGLDSYSTLYDGYIVQSSHESQGLYDGSGNDGNDYTMKMQIMKNVLEMQINEMDDEIKKIKLRRNVVAKKLDVIISRIVDHKENKSKTDGSTEDEVHIGNTSSVLKQTNHEHTIITSENNTDDKVSLLTLEPDNAQIGNKLQRYFEAMKLKKKSSGFDIEDFENIIGTKGQLGKTLKRHDDYINSLAINAQLGVLSSTANLDNEIKLWDISTTQCLGVLSGHRATVNTTRFIDDTGLLASAGKDASVKVWDVDNIVDKDGNANDNLCLATFDGHKDSVTALATTGNAIVSGSNDKTLRHWDLGSGKCIQSIDLTIALKMVPQSVSKLDITPSFNTPLIGGADCIDNALVTGTKDGIVYLWDLRIGRVVGSLEGHRGPITSLKYMGSELITGSMDKSTRIWDLRMGSVAELLSFEKEVVSVEESQTQLINALEGEPVKIYDRGERQYNSLPDSFNTTTLVVYESLLALGNDHGDITWWSL